jgi:uncharacterized protein (TIGR02118 family)
MLRASFCLRGTSREQFATYWRETHAPLVVEAAPALGMVAYFQVHTVHERANQGLRGERGGPEPYDGIAEAWFEDLSSALEAFLSPRGREAWQRLADDERRFIDLSHSPIFFGQAVAVIEPTGPGAW